MTLTAPILDGVAPSRGSPGQPLATFRRSAFEWVLDHGFPTRKDEAWKYSHLGPILRTRFERASSVAVTRTPPGLVDRLGDHGDGVRLLFVNGYFAPQLSSGLGLVGGVRVRSLASELASDRGPHLEGRLAEPFLQRPSAFTALNVALAEDGALLDIPADARIEAPIHLVFASGDDSGPVAAHPRVMVRAGPRSRATIVETHVGLEGVTYLNNVMVDLVLSEDAAIVHHKLQDESRRAFHVALFEATLQRGARLTAHSLALGAAVARHEVHVRLLEPGADVTLNGLYIGSGSQHLDNPTRIEHAAPSCSSRELYKGVMGGRSRGSFDGHVVVDPGATSTDARQLNQNLLLSEGAEVDMRPRLEIRAEDVKCSHGAAVGQLDENQLLYLRSRGIPGWEARRLLLDGFVRDVLDGIQPAGTRSRLASLVAARMAEAAAEVPA